jgi:eukaryotic-like serine/threonine-protein kinase
MTNWQAGRTFLHLGMTARARLLHEKSLEFLPAEWPFAHFGLSTTYLLEGKSDEATAQIQRMLAISGSAPEALLFAGHHALVNGDLPAARRYFEQGLQDLLSSPSWPRTWGTLGLAWVLQRSGETERARDLTRDATRLLKQRWGGPEPRRLEDYADLARVRVLEGDREGALQAFEESVRRGWRLHNDGINNPILESLRGDPRYDRLMAEVKADVDRMRARVEREGW